MAVIDEGMDGEQLDGRDAKGFDVIDDLLRSESPVRTPLPRGHGGMELRETAHMGLIDDRVVPWNGPRSGLPFPIEVRVDDDALRHERRAVTLVERQVLRLGSKGVAEALRLPFELTNMGSGVGIEHQLIGVEAMTRIGLIGPVNPQTVHRARRDIRYIAVPEAVGIFRKRQAVELALSRRVEETDFNAARMCRENRKVGAFTIPGSALRLVTAFFDTAGFHCRHGHALPAGWAG